MHAIIFNTLIIFIPRFYLFNYLYETIKLHKLRISGGYARICMKELGIWSG